MVKDMDETKKMGPSVLILIGKDQFEIILDALDKIAKGEGKLSDAAVVKRFLENHNSPC